ncbi:3-hydroxyacyl-[acyl-carrier-protein] dehydratase FabA [Shewanella sp. D64]|uniref:hotdog fold thioesterase n=1 Tax=unclassified Shewanella TaxID=196818 RepID=UPI0022BA3221|nr:MULTISPECIES: beta-ketoacyl synthase N-terminal-like domain-containing protein [unclassified Shewanella]MEC4727111.1 3-hydroxyacyl-[acyl-carrier-protein] dehydratase FabA [Shewanella sp. D64]MEC4737850.1 3-hydroxyacyl-[acyl-carrier-protein] dehydratase FabA [Shewanella sp. E94]WBJ93895.1 3-hydroxyacyl-[acyl-carrier-protein] dehydratase FabA [Shewanella sp. MTB7]
MTFADKSLTRSAVKDHKQSKIAIVGLATLYPDAKSPQEFWQNLLDKRDSRSTLTNEKLGANSADYQGVQGQSDRFYCNKGGYIEDFSFDASGYKLSPESLTGLDNSFLWALDTSRKALEDAGIALNNDDLLQRTGVIMGALSFPTARSNDLFLPIYHSAVEKALQDKLASSNFKLNPTNAHTVRANQDNTLDSANGSIAHNTSKVVADALGLGCIQLSLDAACASSVYSLKLACDYLNTGKADVMLAGAVSGADPFFINMGFSIFHAYPDHGVSVPFDADSKGLFAGEGAGVLVLKRLDDAERDGDKIYAVVSGVGLSNDGKGQFVLSPNPKGQVKAFERAYAASDIEPKDIEVIECHATGTPLGDKIELTSMETFFADKLAGSKAPLIGSAKSNLGHLLTAAGMPGIMKMIFAMKQQALPPSINISDAISSPNGLFNSTTLPNQVQRWPAKEGNTLRHAGVSVFGFGGCNAHLLLESYSSQQDSGVNDQALVASQQTATRSPDTQALKVIGLGAHFGPLSSINQLDKAIENNSNGFISLPKKRWKGLEKHAELLAEFGLSDTPKGAYVDSFELDFLRFKLPPNEDDRLISQQLMLMKVTDEAIRDAKLKPGQKVAVLVAMETELELHQFRGRVNLHTQLQESLTAMGVSLSSNEYQALEAITMDSVLDAAKLNQYTSFIGNIMASRIASLWDFDGPAFTISAAEQSVSRCIDVAQNLMSQEHLDAVVIAAVDLSGSFEQVILKNSIAPVEMNPSSSIKSDTWNVGEGAGAIVLIKDESTTASPYGQIDAIAFGHAGRVSSVTDKLFTQTGTDSNDISVVETNVAPGSLVGAEAFLSNATFTNATTTSADSRIGHCFAATGMASLLHGLLTLSHNVNNSVNSKKALVTNISENQVSQLLLSQTWSERQALTTRLSAELKSDAKHQLLRLVTLGGRDIYQHIVDAPLASLASIQSKLAQGSISSVVKQQKLFVTRSMQTAIETRVQKVPQQVTEHVQVASTPVSPTPVLGNPMTSQTKTTPQASTKPNTTIDVSAGDLSAFQQNQQLTQQAHQAFLKSRSASMKVADALLRQQLTQEIAQATGQAVAPQAIQSAAPLAQQPTAALKELTPDHSNVAPYIALTPMLKPCIWNYADLVEYAEGDIAKVFGPDYAIIDSYSRRVRLPTTDYLLVSRVTKLNATMNEYKPCSMTTEYDIPVDAPYLVDGQIPWAVAVESGQCDLMLISYLGIDFENKGERVYRLLDCTLTFLADLPRGGDTLRYDIKINNYARNGETLLFFFSYECFVGDKMVLKMDGGCAGFFTDEELADGKGVIRTEDEIKARSLVVKQTFNPLLDCPKSSFNYGDIHKLLTADIQGCFGPSHTGAAQPSLCFASEKFLMIEQVSKVDRNGGTWGLGLIEGHKQLEANHWYFPCHFQGDQVMAGSLMAEGCGQLLQFYMLHLGMHTQTNNGRFQPLENASQQVRCRGQVLPQSGLLTYRMEVTEIGFSPRPYAKANIDILLNGKPVVDFQNLGVMIKEEDECTRYPTLSESKMPVASLSKESTSSTQSPKAYLPASANAPLMAQIPDLTKAPNKGVIPISHVEAPITPDYPNRVPDTVPFTPYHMFEFATGNIENCFGPEFAIYRGMIPPRTPCGDLQVTTRVIEVNGNRGEFKKPSSCIAEYEVPVDAWYFDKNNHQATMPYSILMEISLQPNGFISGYMGTTLGFPGLELFFRNLDGNGKMLRNVDLRGKTIRNDSRLLSTVMAGTNIIQSFSFELSTDGIPFYEGKAVFGYFKGDALKDQLGLDNGKVTQPWHVSKGITADTKVNLLDKSSRHFNAPVNQPHYRLAGGQLNFIDSVEIVDNGGTEGLGYLYAERTIDPSDWFFQFHFHQDPVMPGSLGVEAIIETMQTYAISKDLGAGFKNPKFGQILSDIKWKYRGQINPLNKQMSMDVSITSIKDVDGKKVITGNASLSKDGLRIYQVFDIAICIEEA